MKLLGFYMGEAYIIDAPDQIISKCTWQRIDQKTLEIKKDDKERDNGTECI